MLLTTVMCLMIKEVIQRWRHQNLKSGTSRAAVAYVARECSFGNSLIFGDAGSAERHEVIV
jgi:hypothetical protein